MSGELEKPTTPTGKRMWRFEIVDCVLTLNLPRRDDILAIEQEAAAMAIARASLAGPVVTDGETLDLGMRHLEHEAVEAERERLRDAIDRLPNAVFLPHDIERIYAGEALPLVSRRALWNLLNPEID